MNTLYFIFISTGLKAVLDQYELFTKRNTRDHLAWTIGNGDPMQLFVSQTVYLANGSSKGEERG